MISKKLFRSLFIEYYLHTAQFVTDYMYKGIKI